GVVERERQVAANRHAARLLELDDLAPAIGPDLFVLDEIEDLRLLQLLHRASPLTSTLLLEAVRRREDLDRVLRLLARALLDLERGQRAVRRADRRAGRHRAHQRLPTLLP